MTRKALYAGSFDPFTIGHEDIVSRAINLFDELTIVVAKSPSKKEFLSVEERVSLLKELYAKNDNIKVESWGGLLVDYAKKNGIHSIVRGLRPTGDFEIEFQMASMNSKLYSDIETVFLMTGEHYYYVSSSLVKEVFHHGGNVEEFLPPNIYQYLKAKKVS